MNKTRFLFGALVALVLLNIVSLALLWQRRSPPPRGEGPRKIIIERLHFDPAQTAAYDLLVEKHRADIRRKDREMAVARQAIYGQLQHGDFSNSDSLFARVGELQMEIERIHLAHFQDIQKLCRAEQLADFEKLVAELERLFQKPKRPEKQ